MYHREHGFFETGGCSELYRACGHVCEDHPLDFCIE